MAPISFDDTFHLKRSSTDAGFDALEYDHQPFGYYRHHALRWKQISPDKTIYPSHDQETIQSLLVRSIGLALEAVGFGGADAVAIESFRAEVEEYMAHFLTSVRQSMLSSRRTQSIPQDYLRALHAHQLTLNSLLPHLDPPVSSIKSQVPLIVVSTPGDEQVEQLALLGRFLKGADERRSSVYVPQHFPDLPSRHTYKATAEFSTREQNPRKIRERATEESRLGEEALRRLVGAGSMKRTPHDLFLRPDRKDIRRRREELWKETMEALTQDKNESLNPGNLHNPGAMDVDDQSLGATQKGRFLGPAVNADRNYWRKGSVAKPQSQARQADVSLAGHPKSTVQ